MFDIEQIGLSLSFERPDVCVCGDPDCTAWYDDGAVPPGARELLGVLLLLPDDFGPLGARLQSLGDVLALGARLSPEGGLS